LLEWKELQTKQSCRWKKKCELPMS
jgi:hypothetical protein